MKMVFLLERERCDQLGRNPNEMIPVKTLESCVDTQVFQLEIF